MRTVAPFAVGLLMLFFMNCGGGGLDADNEVWDAAQDSADHDVQDGALDEASDGVQDCDSDIAEDVFEDIEAEVVQDITGDTYQDESDSACDDVCDGIGDDVAASFTLSAPQHVSLPIVVVGGNKPHKTLNVTNLGGMNGTQDLLIEVDGTDFAVTGDTAPLAANESRALEVSFAGSTDTPVITQGTVRLSSQGQSVTVHMLAVVGDAALPANPEWTTINNGISIIMGIPSAPFPHSSATYTDDSVMVVVPEGLREDAAFDVVMHIHGFNCTISTTIPAVYLAEQFLMSGRNAVFIIPQGPVNAADGNFGKLMEAGGFSNLVRDVVSVLYRDGLVTWPIVEKAAITSHSGGYQATAAILRNADMPISTVHLFDSLYGDLATFRAFAQDGGLLRSNYTASGGTSSNNTTLLSLLQGDGLAVGTVADDDSLFAAQGVIVASSFSHSESLWAERNFARWLRQSDILPHRLAPPEVRFVLSDGTTASVSWMIERADPTSMVLVEGSADGVSWQPLSQGDTPPIVVPASAYVRLRRVDVSGTLSAPSDAYPGSGSAWLVVDGFDRVMGGSFHQFTHDFAAILCKGLGEKCSGASNEAVALGHVELGAFSRVLWMLGDESRRDITFDADERAAIDKYLADGGRLLVSGSEVGYATGADWFSSALHAQYEADSAGTDKVDAFTFAVAYPVPYPDVLSGSTEIWQYDTGGAAAVGWQGKVAVVGFPLETLAIDDASTALGVLKAYLTP